MALFDFGKTKKLKARHNEEINAIRQNVRRLEAMLQRNISLYPNYQSLDNSERYATTDDVYSIVRMLSTTAALVPLYCYLVKNDDAAKQLHRLTQPHSMPFNTKSLMLKALEDLPEKDPVVSLLNAPGQGLSKFEFFEAVYTLLFIEGEVFIYKAKPEDGVNAGKPVELLLLMPQNVVLKVTDTMPRKVVAYDYVQDGFKIFENIPTEDVIHIKYFNPYVYRGTDSYLRGLSPISVLKKRLTQLDSTIDVATAQLQNGGIETIVYDKSFSDNQAAEINGMRKDAFYRFLKDTNNAGAPYFSSGEMGAINLGSTLADMQVLESGKINFKKLCNVFGTSDILFNNGEASTESNVREMIKRTYTNTILPNVYRVRDALILGLLPDFKDGKKRDIREDITEIPELQSNYKEMAETFAALPIMLPNEILRAFKLPFDEADENLSKIYVKQGYEAIDYLSSGIDDIPPIDE